METATNSRERNVSEYEPTPGPWRAGGNHVFAKTASGGGEQWIASTDSPYVSARQPIANARLIAAAPDMLAALEMVAQDVRSGSFPTQIQTAIVKAIAKAKGDQ